MEDNNPTLWDEAYWNTADALQLQANNNNLMLVDGVDTQQPLHEQPRNTPVGNSNRNSSDTNNSESKIDNSLHSLYYAPGYRG